MTSPITPLSDAAVRHLQRSLDHPDPGARYEVGEEIGRGGMGAVYRAVDRTLGREVALKVLTFEGDASAIGERLTREARILARLEHPGIVAVHDAGTLTDGRPYYVMRLVRGTTLAQQDAGRGRGALLRLFLQVCDAVAFANARGVIHRDLTPGNVMVGEFGEVLVVDWGVARVMADARSDAPLSPGAAIPPAATTSGRTADGIVVGTHGFIPPEQAAGGSRDADQRADVFGLGAILRSLIARDDAQIPRPLAAIVARATAPEPGDRYPSATALAADVRRWLDAEPVEAYDEGVVERVARFYRRNRPLILLIAAYAVVRVTILLWRGI